jgi:hypothetical protein
VTELSREDSTPRCHTTLGEQLSFDQVTADAARADGIIRADLGVVHEAWRAAAWLAILDCARRRPDFTADDVIERLDRLAGGPETHSLAALGPLFLRAARARLIEKTGGHRPTRIARRHRDLVVWQAGPELSPF